MKHGFMILAMTILFLLATLLSEYYIYSKELSLVKGIYWRRLYIWGSVIIWGWTVVMYVLFKIFPNLPAGLFRFFEGTTPFFLFMCVAKIIFAFFAWLGRVSRKRTLFYSAAIVVMIAVNCVMTYAATTGRWNIKVERADMVSERVPESLDGFRIAVFSDVHAGTLLDRHTILRRMVREINDLDADIVINCGDLINRHYTELEPEILSILSGIKSTYGVYSAVGNHEMGKYITMRGLTPEENLCRIRELLGSIGWKLLIDTTVFIDVGEETISVTGIGFPEELIEKKSHAKLTRHTDYSYLYKDKVPGDFNITISHTPRTWEDILATGRSTLTLSGHVHAGQLKVRVAPKQYWSPMAISYEHWGGMYSEDGRYLYVNNGIGYSMVPLRIGVKPEVTLIELRKCGS